MASQPQPADPKFANDEARALHGTDEDVYEKLGLNNHAKHENDSGFESVCNYIGLQAQGPVAAIESRPSTVPFPRQDVLDLHDKGLGAPHLRGSWSVSWANTSKNNPLDVPYPDNFRGVFSFRSMEFMIRPVVQLNYAAGDPLRLHIGWQDIQRCLKAALDANPDPQMTLKIGYGQMYHPEATRKAPKPDINFEWRLDRGAQSRLALGVKRWRHAACGGFKVYGAKKAAIDKERALSEYYDNRLGAQNPASLGQGPLLRPYIPSTQPQQTQHYPEAGGYRPQKRSSISGADLEAGPSSKRRSIGSQSDIPASPAVAPFGMGQYPPMGSGSQAGLGQPSMASGLWSMRSGQPLEKFPTPISGSSQGMGYGQAPGGFQQVSGQQQQHQISQTYPPPPPLGFTPGQPGVFPPATPHQATPQQAMSQQEVQRQFQAALDMEIKAAKEQEELERSMEGLGPGRGGAPPPSQYPPTGPQAGRGGGPPSGTFFPRGGPQSGAQGAQGRGLGIPATTPQHPQTGSGAGRAGQGGVPPSGPSSARGGNQSGRRGHESDRRRKHSGRRGQERGA